MDRVDGIFEAPERHPGRRSRCQTRRWKCPGSPFQFLFDEAVKAAPAEFRLWDGIHPSPAGHALMARQWREGVGI